MADLITERHCKGILSNLDVNYIFESFHVKPLEQKSLGGLIGKHFHLQIKYHNENKIENLQLFMKVLNKENKLMYNISKELCFFEKEKLFYSTLMNFYEKSGIELNLVPKIYMCEDEIIVLEDLSLKNFKLTPKDEPLDIEHCHARLSNIAKFHALTILYELKKSEILGRRYLILEDYPDILIDLVFSSEGSYATQYVLESVQAMIKLAEIEFKDADNLQLFESILVENQLAEGTSTKNRCTILHGDLWSNNFLHKYEKNFIKDTKMIDFQLIKYGPPAMDFLQFIYSNTRRKFRDDNFNDLIDYYYKSLDEILQEKGFRIEDILPKTEFLASCESLRFSAKLQSTIDRCHTCLPDGVYLNILGSEESFRKFLFENRSECLIECYTHINAYRDVVSEDLRELEDMVISMKNH